ncbi:hypothetical protein [Aquimarina sp. I32.4]|uniref:hypothetical protein n=1 Tax=Aquimarina sp. I32.4 TaxID=2053903 RepID=UPI000CDEBDA2|nr:hypothetical protein [Aquimarina sp. I32.4]
MFDKRNSKKESKEFWSNLDKEVSVSDHVFKEYVNNIFAEEYRTSSYRTLLEAKNSLITIKAYHNFINVYELQANGEDSFGNICCMPVDYARDLLREEEI